MGMNMGKILFFKWNAFMQEGIERALQELNIDYDTFYYIFKDWEKDDEFVSIFQSYVMENHHKKYDTVFSVNYSPLISSVCMEAGIHYVSWVYDEPLHIRSKTSLKNSCNDIYFFDRMQCKRYAKRGVNAHHMPLAADSFVFSEKGIEQIIKKRKNGAEQGVIPKEHINYDCDVSLVGKLYKSDYNYICTPLDQYLRGYLEGIVEAQKKVYGGCFIRDMVTSDLLKKLNNQYIKASNGLFRVTKDEMNFVLGTEVTGRERYMALALLQNRCNVHVYSDDTDERLNKVKFRGHIDYYTQMPKIFRASKINLNISLKLIETGIPLRVLDVLGCNGFLITNYQQELLEYFEPEIDLVIYNDMVDLVTKVEYYLKHDNERNAIARNGYEKVKKLFNFKNKLSVMLL